MKLSLLILITLYLVACSEDASEYDPEAKNLSFKCEQKIPEFTLGAYSDPPQEAIDSLCSCIWKELDGWEKETSIAISDGRENDVSAMHMRAFPGRFGSIMESCGAMSL